MKEMKGMKIMKRIQFLTLILVVVFLSACGEELMVSETNISTPIVEGYLTTDASVLSVKVYSMESFEGDNSVYSNAITKLDLYINDKKLIETTNGTYTLNHAEDLLESGKTCELKFAYNNQIVNASTAMPSRIQNLKISQSVIYRDAYAGFWDLGDTIPDVVVTWDNPDNSFYQVYIWSLDQSGSSQTPFNHGGFGKMMMQPFQGNSYTLRGNDMSFFGRYVCYLYKVNKDYAELYERISSSDLANPVSFIKNGLGVFTGMSADTISYRVEEIEE